MDAYNATGNARYLIPLERIYGLKLHQSRFAGQNAFSGYGEGHVLINGERRDSSVVVLPDEVRDWPGGSLEADALSPLRSLPVEILLLGTGRRLRFPAAALIVAFRQQGLGLEVMDTQAACRTYNILLAEGRKVGAALIIEASA